MTFKLSFNDYYAQDISNKIKSVKARKIEKGEFQGGIAPYGYKKDTNIKNHLIIDEKVSHIVKRIFEMYVYNNMSIVDIADKLNEEKILPPCLYLEIPTFMQKESESPQGYQWGSSQISKMLKNEVYIGNVVGRKFRKISHKVEKTISTKRSEYIIVENKHEPIIDMTTWNKAQEKIGKWISNRKGIYEPHPLKSLVYCMECGGKATYKVKKVSKSSDETWEKQYFVCSKKNSGKKGGCTCKAIQAEKLTKIVQEKITSEINKVIYTAHDLYELYKKADEENNARKEVIQRDLKDLKTTLDKKNEILLQMYDDRTQGIISVKEYTTFRDKVNKEILDLEKRIEDLKTEVDNIDSGKIKIDYERIEKVGKEFLRLDKPTREIYEELIERIEFDSNENINLILKYKQDIDNKVSEKVS